MREARLFLFSALGLLAYAFIAFGLRRWEWYFLFPAFAVAGVSYWYSLDKFESGHLLPIGLLFRMVFLFALPNLSDDYFRFLWDGLQLLEGVNPYHFKPEAWIGEALALPNWFYLQNSLEYYSIYPPLNQYFFAGIGFLGARSIFGFQLVATAWFIIGDVMLYFGLKKLLKQVKLKENLVYLYWLSPLVIVELIGNLHFELWLMLFLVLSLSMLLKGKAWWAGLFLALSVCMKLSSLMALPLFILFIGFRKGWKMLLSFCLFTFFICVPLLDQLALEHFTNSLSLYFGKFEFHSSLFRALSWVGVEGASGILFGLAYLAVCWMAYRRKASLPFILLLAFAAQLLTGQMAHPWYFVPVLILGILSNEQWMSLAVLFSWLSYATYAFYPYEQQAWAILLSYLSMIIVFVLYKKRALRHLI